MLEALRLTLFLPLAMAAFKPISLLLGVGRGHVAFFIFGDSLLDAGNNNYLTGVPKSNHWPYGETFFGYPTGRVCDGRIPPDFICEYAKLPLIRPYLEPNFTDYTNGANFASAGAGVLPETRPGTLYLELQVSFFKEVTERLKQQKGDQKAQKIITQAVYHFGMGGNDYMVLEKNSLSTNTTLSPQDKRLFVRMVLGNLTASIKKVYQLGGRKFSFQNVGPIGCMPVTRFEMRINGCWNDTDVLAEMHNKALPRLLAKLEKQLPGFKYTLFDYHTTLLDRIMNYSQFGFKVGKSACCGSGSYNGNSTCGVEGDYYTLCSNPGEFVFFDGAHPTESANEQLAYLMWGGEPPMIGPYSLKTFFENP